MTMNDKIIDEKFENDINRTTAKTSALSSSKIKKCEYHLDEEMFPTQQHTPIEVSNSI